jgi:hypothetical protein
LTTRSPLVRRDEEAVAHAEPVTTREDAVARAAAYLAHAENATHAHARTARAQVGRGYAALAAVLPPVTPEPDPNRRRKVSPGPAIWAPDEATQ